MNDNEINDMCNPPNDKGKLRPKVCVKEFQNRVSKLVCHDAQQNGESIDGVVANHHQVLLVFGDRVLLLLVFRTFVEI